LLRRHWEIGKAAADASRPHDFHPSWEASRLMLTAKRDEHEVVLLGAFVEDRMWGAALVRHPLLDNLHMAEATYAVHPDRQRQGIGRALAEASYDVARRHDRRLVTTEAYAPLDGPSAGLLFGEAMGFEPALTDGMKVVDLPATEHLWEGLEAVGAPRREGYRIVTWIDAVPEELLADYCALCEMFMDEAPMGELEVERETWTVQRVRSRERFNAAVGRHDLVAGALAPDGSLVALTEAGVSEHASHRGFQSGTIVDPAHRGRGLGLAVKLANHRRLREVFPDCRVLLTGNADVNSAMNAVNERLGYREVERCVEMQRVV
jgi:GNAT superfamily N-acetyltransferase